jgi:hypothetical protein
LSPIVKESKHQANIHPHYKNPSFIKQVESQKHHEFAKKLQVTPLMSQSPKNAKAMSKENDEEKAEKLR